MQGLDRINGKYPRLFNRQDESDDEPSRYSEWGWYIVLDGLSNSDRTKWDYFLNMKVIEFLNTLAFYKDKQDQLRQMNNGTRLK